METIKSFTDIEQSKILSKILKPESSDVIWDLTNPDLPTIRAIPYEDSDYSNKYLNIIPAWSLAALLELLELPTLEKDSIGKDKTGWTVTHYDDGMRYDTTWYNNPIDACYEMILKLNKLNLL